MDEYFSFYFYYIIKCKCVHNTHVCVGNPKHNQIKLTMSDLIKSINYNNIGHPIITRKKRNIIVYYVNFTAVVYCT